MVNSKIIAVIALIGIGCFLFAAFGTPYFKNYSLENENGKAVADNGGTNMTLTTAIPFHLDFNQVCQMQIKVHLNTSLLDDTLRVIIISNLTYNTNSSNCKPQDLISGSGLKFDYYNTQYPQAPATTTAATSWSQAASDATNTQYTWHVDFMGTLSGATTNFISIPGDYYAVIWDNDSTPNGSNVVFDLKIELSGLDQALNTWFNYIGLGLLIFAGVLTALYIQKEGR
jgi:hypothetical protein